MTPHTKASAIRKEVQIGDCRLLLGDCAAIMPDLADFDAVLTDPPYGLGDRMQGGTWGAKHKYTQMRSWDQSAPQESVSAIIAKGVPTIIWGGNYFEVPASRCWLSWSKMNAVPTMAALELAWTNIDRPAKEFRLPVGVHDSGHPTQKPTELMAWCLGFLPSATAILDPFMGSGTTGVACVKLGRSFIGIEIDEGYFDIAVERIRKAYAQPDFFIEPRSPEPKQEALSL